MSVEAQKLDYLIDPNFQEVNKIFVLSFENKADRRGHRILSSKHGNKRLQCYDRCKIFFDQPIRNYVRADKNIRKIATGQGDDYTTGCLPYYPCFKENYKLFTID